MERIQDGFRRIAFVIGRSTKVTRGLFRGVMLYARRHPQWFVCVFEVGPLRDESYLDFGSIRPDGVVVCGVPVRVVRRVLDRQGASDVPIVNFMQAPLCGYRRVATAQVDMSVIARTAIDIFRLRGCRSVAYVGAQLSNEVRASRTLGDAFAAVAAEYGLVAERLRIPILRGAGLRVAHSQRVAQWLNSLPKPFGVLTWNDPIGSGILDICRHQAIRVPGTGYVLGIDNSALICESATPTLSSVEIDFEQAGRSLAQMLDDMIDFPSSETPPHLVCGVKGVRERESTQDSKGVGRLVSLACGYIAEHACREGGLSPQQLADELGVSLRTLQLRFKASSFERTILQEIRRVQLENVARLLADTDRPLADIIYSSGFKSLSGAKTLFLAKYGMGMRDYRKSRMP